MYSNIKYNRFIALEPLESRLEYCLRKTNFWNLYVLSLSFHWIMIIDIKQTLNSFLIIGFCSIIIYFTRTICMYVHICSYTQMYMYPSRFTWKNYESEIHEYDNIEHAKSLVWYYMFMSCTYVMYNWLYCMMREW